jgi:hypothetical protein
MLKLFIAIISFLSFVAASNVTIVGGNSCTSAATSCGITLTEIESYNLNIDCSDLQIGDVMYCQADTVTVVSGSSCTTLAASCNLTLTQFESYNSKVECTALQVGEVLSCIPTSVSVVIGDTCTVLASVCGLTLTEFDNYNPSISCTDLQLGQVFSCTPPNVTVVSGSTCTAIASTCDISLTLLQTYNPSLVCTDLQLGEVVSCVAPTSTPTTTTTSVISTTSSSTSSTSTSVTTVSSNGTSTTSTTSTLSIPTTFSTIAAPTAIPSASTSFQDCIGLGAPYEYRYCLETGSLTVPDDATTKACCVNPENVYTADGFCRTYMTNATNWNNTIHDCCYNNKETIGGNWTNVGEYQAWTPEQVSCLVKLYPDLPLTNRSTIPIVLTGAPQGYGYIVDNSTAALVSGIIGQNITVNGTSSNITSIFLNSTNSSTTITTSTSTTMLSLAPYYTTSSNIAVGTGTSGSSITNSTESD